MSFALLCLMSIAMLSAQGVEEVTLVVSGDGATKEEATHAALRSAIEQTFGCFVSANTEILNDSLVKDEIVTVTSGSISSYDELNVTELDSALISVTLRATVSVNKLISYAKSKGSSCELSGALLTQEKRMLEMNIANTKKALNHLFTLVNEFVEKNDIWTYSLNITNVKMNGYVTGTLTCKRNENGDNLVNMIKDYLAALSIDDQQVAHFSKIGFDIYTIGCIDDTCVHLSDGPHYIPYLHRYNTYADLSCISQELKQSIQKNIDRRALVLFTDNLGFVYPTSNAIRSNAVWDRHSYLDEYYRRCKSDCITISLGNTFVPSGNIAGPSREEREESQSIWLQIPDQNMAALSNIEIVPLSDSRFGNLVNSLRDQAYEYGNQQLKNKKWKDYSKEDIYYSIMKIGLFYAIQNTMANYKLTKENSSEETIKGAIDFYQAEADRWKEISNYFPYDDGCRTLVQAVGKEASKIAEQLTTGENLYRYNWKSDCGQNYFSSRSTISE